MSARLLLLAAVLPLLIAAPPVVDAAEHAAGGSSGAIPPVPGAVVRAFDPPAHPYGPGHRGVGLAAEPGEVVRAALAGRVTFAGEVAGVGWVTVDHGGGLATTYGPLDPRRVGAGQQVARGRVLGDLAADGTHLHWGARLYGQYLDPLLLLRAWEVHLTAHR